MKKNFLILVFMAAITLSAGSVLADQVTGLTTFTKGTPAIAASVNANFSEIQDSVNDNYTKISSPSLMPDGVTTVLQVMVPVPPDVEPSVGILDWRIYLSGCGNTAVRIGHTYTEIVAGVSNSGLSSPGSFANIDMPPAAAGTFAVESVAGNFMVGLLGYEFNPPSMFAMAFAREGSHVDDTCTGDINVLGGYVEIPLLAGESFMVNISPKDFF